MDLRMFSVTPTNGKMVRTSMKQASSSPKKRAVRTTRATVLTTKKRSSIGNTSTRRNTSATSSKPLRTSANVLKKKLDKTVKVNSNDLSGSIPSKSLRTSANVLKRKSDKTVKVNTNDISGSIPLRPQRKSSTVSKKEPDKPVEAKDNTSETSKRPIRKSVSSRRQPDKTTKAQEAKPTVVRKKSSTTRNVQSKDEEQSSNARKSRTTKSASGSKSETKKKIPVPTGKKIPKQQTLKESFLNQSNSKHLRPRRTGKNYCEDTVRSENSGMETNLEPKEKVPIYKTVPFDEPVNNNCEVYDFQFDKDDTYERIRRKKKRPAKQNVVQKYMKAHVKQKLKEAAAKAVVPSTEVIEVKQKKAAAAKAAVPSTKVIEVKQKKEAAVKAAVPSTKVIEVKQKKEAVPEIPEQLEVPAENPVLDKIQETIEDCPPAEEDANKENVHMSAPKTMNIAKGVLSKPKPLVTSIENVKNKRITIIETAGSPVKEDFRPFRPTNVFNVKPVEPKKNMPNHSLLEKSLSPIMNSMKTFDAGSPWRAPPLFTFSQVKNLFQSTPQHRKLDASSNKFQQITKDSTNTLKPTMPLQKPNNSLNAGNSPFANNQKRKTSGIARRFGTEITNMGHSTPQIDPSVDTSGITMPIATPVLQQDSVNPVTQETAVLREKADKENSILNYETPKKPGKLKGKKVKSNSPLKRVRSRENQFGKENAHPIPGPSGLQKTRSPVEEHGNSLKENFDITPEPFEHTSPLKQLRSIGQSQEPTPGPSGLQKIPSSAEKNNVLISESPRPQSTRSPLKQYKSFDKENIGPSPLQNSRSPGELRVLRQSNLNNYLNIMDMPQSTNILTPHGIFADTNNPPVSMSLKKAEIKNAFGFDDDTPTEEIPVAENCGNEKVNKQEILKGPAPARLSIREIKNHLVSNRIQEVLPEPTTRPQRSPVKAKAIPKLDIDNFSDTFDLHTDAEESIKDISNCPLFMDPEPSFFTQPPRHSYKRKRNVHFSFSQSSDSEDEEREVKRKRKKAGKLHKQEEKRLKAWVTDVNKTFEEIDHYDLVVE